MRSCVRAVKIQTELPCAWSAWIRCGGIVLGRRYVVDAPGIEVGDFCGSRDVWILASSVRETAIMLQLYSESQILFRILLRILFRILFRNLFRNFKTWDFCRILNVDCALKEKRFFSLKFNEFSEILRFST